MNVDPKRFFRHPTKKIRVGRQKHETGVKHRLARLCGDKVNRLSTP